MISAESAPTADVSSADPTATNERSAGSSQPPPCAEANLAGVIDPGEAPNVDTFNSAIVVINHRKTVCTIQGFSELEWHTGGNGSTLPIETVRSAGPAELVTLGPGEQASFTMTVTMDGDGARTDCYEGASYAYVTLPGTAKYGCRTARWACQRSAPRSRSPHGERARPQAHPGDSRRRSGRGTRMNSRAPRMLHRMAREQRAAAELERYHGGVAPLPTGAVNDDRV